MKKVILSAIFFLGLTVTAFAQGQSQRVQKSPEERAQRRTDVLGEKLALTESQKKQVYQINLEHAQAMSNFKDARKNGTDRSQIKAQFEATESKLLSILNDQQRASYTQLKAEREAKIKDHNGRKKHGHRNKE